MFAVCILLKVDSLHHRWSVLAQFELSCCKWKSVEGSRLRTIIFNPRNIQLPYQKCNNFTKCTQNSHKFHHWKSVASMCTIILNVWSLDEESRVSRSIAFFILLLFSWYFMVISSSSSSHCWELWSSLFYGDDDVFSIYPT